MIFGHGGERRRLRVAVFASGNGTNLQAILDAIARGNLQNTMVALVLSNNSDAGALRRARDRAIPAVHISRLQFSSDEQYVEAILSTLEAHDVNFIALAGYMKKVDTRIVHRFRNRIVNIHPALLPAFGGQGMYGMHVHEAVLASGTRESGASVHLVDEEYDRGPVIRQVNVPVMPDDTPTSLAARVHEAEHRLYPEVLQLFADNRVHVEGNTIRISDHE